MSEIKLGEDILNVLEDQGWSASEVRKQDNETYCVEIEQYSPAGEDFGVPIVFDGTNEGFWRDVEVTSCDFDVDDHVELWINSRGKNGVPNSIRELVEDAEAIERMLVELSDALWTALHEKANEI